MKFTDGRWLLKKGVRAFHPVQAYAVEASQTCLTAHGVTKKVGHREDTHDTTLLTLELAAPMPDVIRAKISHFSGALSLPPRFDLLDSPPFVPVIFEEETSATLASGRLSARVERGGEWRIEYLADGRLVTSSGLGGMGYMVVEGEGPYMHEQLSLGVGENVYGLGERFLPLVRNGQSVDIWNQDGGTASEQAYKNVPFYLTNRGYGVFVNHPELVSFEVASENISRVQFSVPGQSLEYFIIYGPTPKEVLLKYAALTGKPALPPAWSFGLWLSTSFTTSYDEESVTAIIQGMADREIPLHVFHFDTFWMREFGWCDFQWDPRTFPDPAGMLGRLKSRGLRICLWINPYIAQRSALFPEAERGGFLLKKPNGDVWQTDLWQPGMGVVDFTNPEARAWFAGKLRALLSMGVDCFKTDFGERIPTDVVYHDGSDPMKMHNYYTYLYNRTVFEALREARGEGDALVFARSATSGSQRFPVHWGGDCESTFESMAESLRGGLSLCLSGFGFWSHDIGGFEGTPSAALYKRWIAFGLLSSHSRLHGNRSYRVPWEFDEESSDVLRLFTRLKCRLMPYIYARAIEASQTGAPLMRAMMLEFPDDPACPYLDRQYMLGDRLLVAPVFSEDGVVDYYLPAGTWTSFLTGEEKSGPGWVRETHDFLSIPLLVRPGSVIAVGNREDAPDYPYGDGVTLRIYQLADGATAEVSIPTEKGGTAATFRVHREDGVITVTQEGRLTDWRVLLVGVWKIASAIESEIASAPQGMLVTPSEDQKILKISF